MCSSRRIEKCPQSGWGCMGGGATLRTSVSREIYTRSSCSYRFIQKDENGTQKYGVLWDKKITMQKSSSPMPTGGTFPTITAPFRCYVKLTPSQAKMTYDSPVATSPIKNPIYLYACYADTTNSSQYAPLLAFTGRIRYIKPHAQYSN